MKREKIIETLKSNVFHYDGKGEWKLRNWNFDDIADQLLSEEMGDRMALVYFEVALVEFAKFVWAYEEGNDILTGYNKDGVIETIGFTIHGRSQSDFRFSDKVIELLSKLSHPDQVDESKQLPNTTEGMSDQEIIEFSKREFMLGDDKLPHTVAESFCIRHGAKWMREKLTSNNQQTEGEIKAFKRDGCIFKYCPHPEDCKDECQSTVKSFEDKCAENAKIIDGMSDLSNIDMHAPYDAASSHPTIPQKADSDKGAEEIFENLYKRMVGREELHDSDYYFMDEIRNHFASKPDKEFHQNKCNSCGEAMSNDCPRCTRLWES